MLFCSVASQQGQPSLAIPRWVGAVSTIRSWGVNRLTMPHISGLECKLMAMEISTTIYAMLIIYLNTFI